MYTTRIYKRSEKCLDLRREVNKRFRMSHKEEFNDFRTSNIARMERYRS
jgi:hypothetical protein